MFALIGHERQRSYLNKALAHDRLAHAYIFSGPARVGKRTLAAAMARYFFCEKKPKQFEEACGQCRACLAISGNKYPNVFCLSVERTLASKKEARKNIPIEDIRALKREFALAHAGAWRVVIIEEAEKMTDEAANAFLKLLEEPGANSLFLLTTVHEDLLMPTICSRVARVRLGLVSEEHLFRYARERIPDEARARVLARLAAGRPGAVVQALSDPEFFVSLEKRAQFMERMLKASYADMFRTAQKAAENAEVRYEAVWFLFAAMRNFYLRERSPKEYAYCAALIKKLERIHYIMETTNVNPRLALEALFIEARKMYTI